LNGTQKKNFLNLNLFANKISKIGNSAFNHLDPLTQLDLEVKKLNQISENAFNFSKFNDKPFLLFLYRNSSNSSSFEKRSFNSFHRLTQFIFTYDFKSNNITYLDQHIFEEFLNKNKENGIDSNTIDCNDCHSFWLKKYSKQSYTLICSNNKGFLDDKNFLDCQY
jgi:hypothetical protein